MAYEPLTSDALKEIHSRLKHEFKQVSRFTSNAMPDISAHVSAMANAVSAMIAIEHEIRSQQKDDPTAAGSKDNSKLKL